MGFFLRIWYRNDAKNVGDFKSKDGKVLSKDMFQQKFNIPRLCVMQYKNTITAISSFLNVVNDLIWQKCYDK